MAWEERMHTIERNGKSELKQKLPTPASCGNGTKMDVVVSCCYTSPDSSMMQWKDLGSDHSSSLLLKPPPNLELLVNHLNNATLENSHNPENISSSKYYDINDMHNIKITRKNKLLSLFHINACSLNKHFDDLQHLLSCT